MLIRSQNKKCLVEINKMIILASGKMVICYDTSCIMDEVYVNLGNYSSDEKALKVLDMIQEAYCKFMSVKNDDAWSGKESVFYMPEDSEVEI